MRKYVFCLILSLGIALISCQESSITKIDADLIKQRCTACHSTNRIYKTRRTAEEWNAIIERMIRDGARLEPGDKEEIISFLTR